MGIASDLDWITPAVSLAKCAFGGQRPISVLWNDQPPVYWQRRLRGAGILASSGGTGPDGFILLVSLEDELKARDILWAAGAPLA